MGRKVNGLARDVRKSADRFQRALITLGKIGQRHDDPDLRLAEGLAADAIKILQNAACRFERKGRDYDDFRNYLTSLAAGVGR